MSQTSISRFRKPTQIESLKTYGNPCQLVTTPMKFSFITAAVLVVFASTGRAQIIVSGNVGAGGTGTISIQSDLVFPITATGNAVALVFDEWVTSDGSLTGANILSAGALTVSRGGTPTQVPLQKVLDNEGGTVGGVTANDGYLLFSNYAVTTGDTVTLQAGTWTFAGAAAFNPQTVQTFEGNVFLANQSGTHLSSSILAVPEPSQYAQVAGAGVLGWALMRRFRRNQANRVG